MGKQYKKLTTKHKEFIKSQKLFFMASSSDAEVNLSPKGYDSIRVLNDFEVIYLDYPGSGNRTARDIENGGGVTLMFNAFEGDPQILRLFCKGKIIKKEDEQFLNYLKLFNIESLAVRQLFKFDIYAVESSCGEAVPVMRFDHERKSLKEWAKNMAIKGTLEKYISDHHVPVDLNNIEQ